MDFILGKFEEGKTEFEDHPQLSKMFNSRWAKLNKYYQLTDETPVYIVALVLNCRRFEARASSSLSELVVCTLCLVCMLFTCDLTCINR